MAGFKDEAHPRSQVKAFACVGRQFTDHDKFVLEIRAGVQIVTGSEPKALREELLGHLSYALQGSASATSVSKAIVGRFKKHYPHRSWWVEVGDDESFYQIREEGA
jgi:predicted methyltransferase MtxX (methanogen marker protein 4)